LDGLAGDGAQRLLGKAEFSVAQDGKFTVTNGNAVR